MIILSSETRALLLLCNPLLASGDLVPLGARELKRLDRWLAEHSLVLADLLKADVPRMLGDAEGLRLDPQRVATLLSRQRDVDALLARCAHLGIWVVGRHDAGYPERYRCRLEDSAPPLLYGIGSLEMSSVCDLAVVGSKRADQFALDIATAIARRCAQEGIAVVSGGARGIDATAITTVLAEGGRAVVVLSHGLALAIERSDLQQPLVEGRLSLLSPYGPDAHFTVGRAMGRNKLIYSLCDWGLVVRSDEGKGGTWAGAQEALRKRWCPLFVSSDVAAAGNRALLAGGAIPFPAFILQRREALSRWLNERTQEVWA